MPNAWSDHDGWAKTIDRRIHRIKANAPYWCFLLHLIGEYSGFLQLFAYFYVFSWLNLKYQSVCFLQLITQQKSPSCKNLEKS